jgi:Uncharacterized ABC-type transport system, periplasmic component/surface lipoprotein
MKLQVLLLICQWGKIHPFTGPINKQDGSAWLADGETPPNYPDLLTMDFYVEGIEAKYPN